ncbi:hypothetical protein BB559_004140 [Furculomyces boomerangus]|uniref:Uncharacterized protein n=1 Tax=Furculomyces boomerangus TaxID=61424 RepID=A0A2T9YGI1_9FUNG|nr:hypothetical protein BB559_004140 [Furculomyces boomerangus]
MILDDLLKKVASTIKVSFQNELKEIDKKHHSKDAKRQAKKLKSWDDIDETGNKNSIISLNTLTTASALASEELNINSYQKSSGENISNFNLTSSLKAVSEIKNPHPYIRLLEKDQMIEILSIKKSIVCGTKEEREKILKV